MQKAGIIMPSNTIGDQYLQVFDDLDPSSNEERRIGVLVLEEFFGQVMTKIGRNLLPKGEPYHNRNLVQQWGSITGWFQTEDIDIPNEYGDTIGKLKSIRDNVAHNYLTGVNRETLIEIRKNAEPIRDWLLERGREYHRESEKYSEVQAIEKRAEQLLNRILGVDSFNEQFLDEQLDEIQEEASSLETKLSRISKQSQRSNRRIPYELVEILHKSQKLDRQVWGLHNQKEELDDIRFSDSDI